MLAGLAGARAMLEARAVAQPFGTYTQALSLIGKSGNRHRQVLIACNGFREIVKAQPQVGAFVTPAWERHDLDTGHWPMLSAPESMVEVLAQLAPR
jgi:hypothetical protein